MTRDLALATCDAAGSTRTPLAKIPSLIEAATGVEPQAHEGTAPLEYVEKLSGLGGVYRFWYGENNHPSRCAFVDIETGSASTAPLSQRRCRHDSCAPSTEGFSPSHLFLSMSPLQCLLTTIVNPSISISMPMLFLSAIHMPEARL